MRRFWMFAGAIALLASGCTSTIDGRTEVVLTGDAPFEAGGASTFHLRPFASCDSFLDTVKAEALARVGPFGVLDTSDTVVTHRRGKGRRHLLLQPGDHGSTVGSGIRSDNDDHRVARRRDFR